MPRKPKTPTRKLSSIPKDRIDQSASGPMTAGSIEDLSAALKKALIRRALGSDLGQHLGYEPGAEESTTETNRRNGHSAKKILKSDGPLHLQIPRDRDSSFEPILIPKPKRLVTGFDDKIITTYARGMTVGESQAFLQEQYGTEVSPEFISSVTDAVMDKVLARRNGIRSNRCIRCSSSTLNG